MNPLSDRECSQVQQRIYQLRLTRLLYTKLASTVQARSEIDALAGLLLVKLIRKPHRYPVKHEQR